ncbi:MAG: protoporphyrinogen/coproporphyrinogen oxidase [Candidatus Nanoarchaeia archaeon]
MKKIAVIGAGIAGLSAAYELTKLGYKVKVFEKNDHPGGRMSARWKDNLAFDFGADFLAENYTQLKAYASELNVEWGKTEPNGAQCVVRDGEVFPLLLSGPLDVLRFKVIPFMARIKLLIWCAKLRTKYKRMNFFNLSILPEDLDFDNANSYLNKHVHKDVADYIADPFTSSMQFHRCNEISTATMFALMKMMVTPELNFWLTRTKGGMGAIPEALAKRLDITLNTEVSNVTPKDRVIHVVHAGKRSTFDAVVLATTADVAKKILKNPTAEQKHILDATKYASTLVISFKAPAGILGNAHCTYVPFVENQVIGGYTNEGRKGEDFIENGKSLINVYLHESTANDLMKNADEDIYALVQRELAKVCPNVRGKIHLLEPHDIHRWAAAMPKFDYKFITIAKRFTQHFNGQNNIYLAGDYLNSPWTEGACRCGTRVAQMIHKRSS